MTLADWVIVAVILGSTIEAAIAGFFQVAFGIAWWWAGVQSGWRRLSCVTAVIRDWIWRARLNKRHIERHVHRASRKREFCKLAAFTRAIRRTKERRRERSA